MKKLSVLFAVGLSVLLTYNLAIGATEMIGQGKTVKFNYKLTVDGAVVDSSEGKEPLEYVQGNNMLIPGLEVEMEGLKAGDKKTVEVTPKDGYGEFNEQMIVEIEKARLGLDSDPQVGMGLQVTTPNGPIAGVVKEIKSTTIVVDFNHPLSGKTLNFDVDIVEVK